MTEETNRFFFEFVENSTELYREAKHTEEFAFKSFFEEPNSDDLFIEVQVGSCEEENLFDFEPSQRLIFPNVIGRNFARLLSASSHRSEKNQQESENKEKNTTKRKRVRKIKREKKTQKKVLAKSEITKNACCNIVQKTISLIKKGEYEEKLNTICEKFNVEIEKFRTFILNEKTRFTGTKALELFLSEKKEQRMVFAEFLGWFLREKYIRHAIMSGEMSNLDAYIKFKNEIILPLL